MQKIYKNKIKGSNAENPIKSRQDNNEITMGLISNAIQNANQREALAAQLVNYFQQHQSEIKSGVDSSFGGFMINTSDIYGEDLNKDALASIFKHLQHDSDGDAIIETRNYQFGVQYGYGYISVPGYNEVGGASYSQTETDAYMGTSEGTTSASPEQVEAWNAFVKRCELEDGEEREEQKRQERERKEQERAEKQRIQNIKNGPMPPADEIVFKIKECEANIKHGDWHEEDAWRAYREKLIAYAKLNYKDDPKVKSFLTRHAIWDNRFLIMWGVYLIAAIYCFATAEAWWAYILWALLYIVLAAILGLIHANKKD